MNDEDAKFIRSAFNERLTLYLADEEEAEAKSTYDKVKAIFKELKLPEDPVELFKQDGHADFFSWEALTIYDVIFLYKL